MSQAWQVRLAEQAELDFLDIATWTTQHFGQAQAELYVETILLAMEALHDGPDPLGAKARDDIGPGILCQDSAEKDAILWCSWLAKGHASMCFVCCTTAWIWPDTCQ